MRRALVVAGTGAAVAVLVTLVRRTRSDGAPAPADLWPPVPRNPGRGAGQPVPAESP